jgi:hypothetical protein
MSYDIYGPDIAPMTFMGDTSINSTWGGFVSILVKVIVLMFVSVKFGEMIFQKSQKINQLLL